MTVTLRRISRFQSLGIMLNPNVAILSLFVDRAFILKTMHLEALSLTPPPTLISFLEDLGQGENGFGGSTVGQVEFSLPHYLQGYCDMTNPTRVKTGHARQSNYWILNNENTVIGMLKIRHTLTTRTEICGGHIGYYIHKNHRGCGNGKQALILGLDKLRSFGVSRALVTIYPENKASIRIALAAGGQYDNTVTDPDSGRAINRYWIDLNHRD